MFSNYSGALFLCKPVTACDLIVSKPGKLVVYVVLWYLEAKGIAGYARYILC